MYNYAKEAYQKFGVDTEKALEISALSASLTSLSPRDIPRKS